MAVHLSIHDVSPAWTGEVEEALALCAEVGAKPALLVVPNFHGAWPIEDHPAFGARMRELQAAGHEVYLHGFFHRSRDRAGTRDDGRPRGARWYFAQRVASAGEAEFGDVSRAEAEERLDRGERALRGAGLAIDGFVAPAWSMPRWLVPMLGARGYRFAEDHLSVYDPARGARRASVVLNYASRTRARMWSTVAWCRAAKHARALVPARVAIHPGDLRVPLLRRELRRLLAWGAGDYVPRAASLFQGR
jgi:predicted deacetylase